MFKFFMSALVIHTLIMVVCILNNWYWVVPFPFLGIVFTVIAVLEDSNYE